MNDDRQPKESPSPSEAPSRRRSYERPCIVSSDPIEGRAGVCSPLDPDNSKESSMSCSQVSS